jgi:hypothetical protein
MLGETLQSSCILMRFLVHYSCCSAQFSGKALALLSRGWPDGLLLAMRCVGAGSPFLKHGAPFFRRTLDMHWSLVRH